MPPVRPRANRASATRDGYTIDDLAARSGVPSRTIRYYQSEGALPAPRRQGRVALYDEDHLERLRLIGELRARGLSLGLITTVVGRSQRGSLSVVGWLDLTDRMGTPWLPDQPAVVTADDLARRLEGRQEALLPAVTAAGLVEPAADGTFRVLSPALLGMAVELDRAGVDPDTAVRAEQILRQHIARATDEVVSLLVDRAGHGFGRRHDPSDLATAFEALRPIAIRAVALILSQEVDRSLRRIGWPSREARTTDGEQAPG